MEICKRFQTVKKDNTKLYNLMRYVNTGVLARSAGAQRAVPEQAMARGGSTDPVHVAQLRNPQVVPEAETRRHGLPSSRPRLPHPVQATQHAA